MDIEDRTLKALSTAINFRQMRQELISSNIANADTPGFKAKRLAFEEALARAIDIDKQQSLNVSDSKHYNIGGGGFDNLTPEVYEESSGMVTEDGNTVDVEKEAVRMAENKVMYDAAVQLLNKKLGMMKYAVSAENN